jgi:hypothetical protein
MSYKIKKCPNGYRTACINKDGEFFKNPRKKKIKQSESLSGYEESLPTKQSESLPGYDEYLSAYEESLPTRDEDLPTYSEALNMTYKKPKAIDNEYTEMYIKLLEEATNKECHILAEEYATRLIKLKNTPGVSKERYNDMFEQVLLTMKQLRPKIYNNFYD